MKRTVHAISQKNNHSAWELKGGSINLKLEVIPRDACLLGAREMVQAVECLLRKHGKTQFGSLAPCVQSRHSGSLETPLLRVGWREKTGKFLELIGQAVQLNE